MVKTENSTNLAQVHPFFPNVGIRRKAMQRLCFHNSFVSLSEPSLLFGFCVELRVRLYLYLHYVCESVGGAKQAAR